MGHFDFYREAKNNYRHIVPGKEDGLILFLLYEKQENGDFDNDEFSESEIIRAIEQVYADVRGDTGKRNEFERNNDIILRLQDFFLWRDERKKCYRFKTYGLDFCLNIKKQLQEYYSPTEIKSIFDSLVNELKLVIGIDNGFSQWIKLHFSTRSIDLARQVEILDQQVNEAVKYFRLQIKSIHREALVVINEALESLASIKQKSDEFRYAFQGTYEMEELVFNFQENKSPTDQELIQIRSVRNFVRRIRTNLELVSKRIDEIQPKIREFIHDFNQKDFDRKTDLFLSFLLKKSKIEKDTKGKKLLVQPDEIQLKVTKESVPVLPIIIRKDIGVTKPIPITIKPVNVERRNDSLSVARKKQFIRQRVAYWITFLQTMLATERSIYFSSFFYRILSSEYEFALTIAIRVSHKAVIKYSRDPAFFVEIENKTIGSTEVQNISLWKMYIRKK